MSILWIRTSRFSTRSIESVVKHSAVSPLKETENGSQPLQSEAPKSLTMLRVIEGLVPRFQLLLAREFVLWDLDINCAAVKLVLHHFHTITLPLGGRFAGKRGVVGKQE
jgi:hypothetical protein